MSHYDTLGVARHATPAQIKRAYQRLTTRTERAATRKR